MCATIVNQALRDDAVSLGVCSDQSRFCCQDGTVSEWLRQGSQRPLGM